MQNQSRDELREKIQNDIRQSIRDAVGRQEGGAVIIGGQGREEAIALLQAQIQATREEITSLTSQLTPGQSRAREQAIEGQLERATDRLESLEEQLAATTAGRTFAISRPSPPLPPSVIPPEVQSLAIWGMCTLGVTIISVAFMRMWSRRLDRRAHQAPPGPDMSPRLDRIEQAIEAVAIEVERISEGQRYTSKMLHDARALPAPGLAERWPAAAEREALHVPRQGEK